MIRCMLDTLSTPSHTTHPSPMAALMHSEHRLGGKGRHKPLLERPRASMYALVIFAGTKFLSLSISLSHTHTHSHTLLHIGTFEERIEHHQAKKRKLNMQPTNTDDPTS